MKYFFFGIMIFSIFFGSVIWAAPNFRNASASLSGVGSETGLGDKDLPTVVGTSINIALSMVGLIFLILTVYAGLLWMTAEGEESKVDKARKMIIAAVIGLTIVMSASGITYLVTSRFETSAPSSVGGGGDFCLCHRQTASYSSNWVGLCYTNSSGQDCVSLCTAAGFLPDANSGDSCAMLCSTAQTGMVNCDENAR